MVERSNLENNFLSAQIFTSVCKHYFKLTLYVILRIQ